jgi:hypothetical protein
MSVGFTPFISRAHVLPWRWQSDVRHQASGFRHTILSGDKTAAQPPATLGDVPLVQIANALIEGRLIRKSRQVSWNLATNSEREKPNPVAFAGPLIHLEFNDESCRFWRIRRRW